MWRVVDASPFSYLLFECDSAVHDGDCDGNRFLGRFFLPYRLSMYFFFQLLRHTLHGTHDSHSIIVAPALNNVSSTSRSICAAVLPPALSYVECAPLSNTTENPSANAARQVSNTQHSLWIPKATIVSTSFLFNSSASRGLEANVLPSHISVCHTSSIPWTTA